MPTLPQLISLVRVEVSNDYRKNGGSSITRYYEVYSPIERRPCCSRGWGIRYRDRATRACDRRYQGSSRVDGSADRASTTEGESPRVGERCEQNSCWDVWPGIRIRVRVNSVGDCYGAGLYSGIGRGCRQRRGNWGNGYGRDRVVAAERDNLSDGAHTHVQTCSPQCLRRAGGVKDHVDHAAFARTKCRAAAGREWAGLNAEAWRIASSSRVHAVNRAVVAGHERQRSATRVNDLYVLIHGCWSMNWH